MPSLGFFKSKRFLLGLASAVGLAGAGYFMAKRINRGNEPIDYRGDPTNPEVVLVTHGDAKKAKNIAAQLISQGYGVVTAISSETVKSIEQLPSIEAVVAEPRYVRDGLVQEFKLRKFGVPVTRLPDLEEIIKARRGEAYGHFRDIAELTEVRSSGDLVDDEVGSTIMRLMSGSGKVLGAYTDDSHTVATKRGIAAALRSGKMVRPDRYYDLNGIAIKEVDWATYQLMRQDELQFQNAQRARPAKLYFGYFPNGAESSKGYIVTELVIGPQAIQLMHRLGLDAFTKNYHQMFREGAARPIHPREFDFTVDNIVKAIFNVYFKSEKYFEGKSPMGNAVGNSLRIEIQRRYLEKIGTIFQNRDEPSLATIVQSTMLPEHARYIFSLDGLRNAAWFGLRERDLLPANTKLSKFGREVPTDKDILDVMFPEGRALSCERIEDSLVFYDPGFQPRHKVDNASRVFLHAGLGAIMLPVDTSKAYDESWIDRLSYFLKGEFQNGGIPLFAKTRFERGELEANVLGMMVYKTASLMQDAWVAAVRTEREYAAGMLSPTAYVMRQKQNVGQLTIYSANLCTLGSLSNKMAVKGNRHAYLNEFIDEIRSTLPHSSTVPATSSQNDFAESMRQYSTLGLQVYLAVKEGINIPHALAVVRNSVPYKVEFKALE